MIAVRMISGHRSVRGLAPEKVYKSYKEMVKIENTKENIGKDE